MGRLLCDLLLQLLMGPVGAVSSSPSRAELETISYRLIWDWVPPPSVPSYGWQGNDGGILSHLHAGRLLVGQRSLI
jgi:hypothetical protein